MKKNIIILLLIMISLSFSLYAKNDKAVKQLNSSQKNLIYDTCFEIVILKSEKDSLTYEKALPWDLLPFIIRNDKYFSIGTAFAVSETELLTAFHVLSLNQASKTYKNFFIRDKNQNVYEVDNIIMLDNHKDFVKFTVKNKKFDKYLKLSNSYQINTTVFSAGNAYGEGVVIRSGDLMGLIPEPENGEWSFLKSSSDVNSGNSGGPLLDGKGQVIGIVVQRKDNICYSLPIGELSKAKAKKGRIHIKDFFGFDLYPDKKDTVFYDYEINLPNNYLNIIKELSSHYNDFYVKNMDNFFVNNKDEFFPNGDNSLEALYGNVSASFPQVIYKDKNSNKWFISNLKTEKSNLDKNGKIIYTIIVNSLIFVDISKPDDLNLKEVYDNPKLAMDLILKGINFPREIAEQKTRILSLGSPYQSEKHEDIYGRKWMVNIFHLEFSDEAIITFSTPTPQGLIYILKIVSTFETEQWIYDLKKIMNFTYISYFGKLKEWKEFFQYKDYLPAKLNSVKFSYEQNKSLSVDLNRFAFSIDNSSLELLDDTLMILNYDIYSDNDKVVWDIRRIMISEDKKDNYFVLFKNIKPNQKLSEDFIKNWNSIVNKNHPYNENPYQEDGRTNIGSILVKNEFKDNKDISNLNNIYSLYFGKEGNIENTKMLEDLKNLKEKINIME